MNSGVRPPRLASALAEWATPPALREHVLGDLNEQFQIKTTQLGAPAAGRWFWRQALASVWHWPIRSVTTLPSTPLQESSMSALLHDARFAARQLLRHPSYLAAGVLSLTLAIAANGVVFGLVNGLILNPFNYPESSTLVSIGSAFPTLGRDRNFIEQHSPPDVDDFAAIPVIERLGAFDLGNRVLSDGEMSERLFTALVLRDPIPALGQPMTLGRGFTAEELAPGGPEVAILSHRIWVRAFGADPAIIGKTVRVTSTPTTVVGVLGAGSPLLGTDLWIPWGGDPSLMPRNNRPFTVVARLTPGASIADVDTALATISARARTTVAPEYPEYEDWRLSAAPWSEAVTGDQSLAAGLLLAVGVVVLLVACVNIASLLMARLTSRQRELAVRRALGASAWRISRLLVMESLIVAAIAAVMGIVLTRAALLALPGLLPEPIARIGFEFSMNTAAVVYCLLAGLVATGLTVAVPAWQTRGAAAASLADTSRAVAGPGRQYWRRALIVTELALAVTLLVTAGLFVRSYGNIARIDPGFDPSGVLTMRLTIDPRVYPGDEAAAFFSDLTSRLAAIPGVTAAAAVNQMPTTARFDTTFSVEGQPTAGDVLPNALLTIGSPNLFDMWRTPLRSGRGLTDADGANAPPVAVVNEAFSRRYLDGASGGHLRVGPGQTLVEVVGVVANVSNQSLIGPVRPEIYATMEQAGQGNNQYYLMVRSAGDPAAPLPAIRGTLAEMDPDQPLYYIQTMDEVMATGVFPQRLAMLLVGVFALGAIGLAIVGVYGLISNWVASRRQEIGIRLALGGNSLQVAGLVVGQAARLIATGSIIGLAGGIAVGSAASSLLFATPPADPWTLATVVVLLGLAGLLAAVLPARRAMVVDPIEVLRSE